MFHKVRVAAHSDELTNAQKQATFDQITALYKEIASYDSTHKMQLSCYMPAYRVAQIDLLIAQGRFLNRGDLIRQALFQLLDEYLPPNDIYGSSHEDHPQTIRKRKQ